MTRVATFQLFKLTVLAGTIVISWVINWQITKVFFSAISRRRSLLLFLLYLLGMLVVVVLTFYSVVIVTVWVSRSLSIHPIVIVLISLLWGVPMLGFTLWNRRYYKNPFGEGKE
jgi:hypothetical protein